MKAIHHIHVSEAYPSICNVAGTLIFICLAIYFLILRTVGLHEVYALRDLNIIFLGTGIFLALRSYKKKTGSLPHSLAVKIGLRVTITAILLFSLFIYYYLTTDQLFTNMLRNKLASSELTGVLGEFMTPGVATLIVCIEGFVSGSILTFLFARYYANKPLKISYHEPYKNK